jgi:hypothetical protein
MELSHKRTSLQKIFDDATAISTDIADLKKDCNNLRQDCDDLCKENGCYSGLWEWIVKLLTCFCCMNTKYEKKM